MDWMARALELAESVKGTCSPNPAVGAILVRDGQVVGEGATQPKGQAHAEIVALLAAGDAARGAVMYQRGAEIARAAPPRVRAVDATGAGDCFVAAICVALLEGMEPEAALAFACAAGAIAATRPGAQPSMPTRDEVEAIITAS